MSLRIGTNVTSLAVSRFLQSSQDESDRALLALSSGSRIVKPGDDAAGFAISENLRGQINGLKQARSNAEMATSFIQVAEGGLNEQNNILIRLRELAVQSASDTVSDQEREFLNEEFSQLISEYDRIAKTTSFGSKKLLAGDVQNFEFQIGPNNSEDNVIRYTLDADTTADRSGIYDLEITSQNRSRKALDPIDAALYSIAGVRANFGAIQSRLNVARDNLDVQTENTTSARSRIVDADVAEEASRLARATVMQNIGISVLAQANQTPKAVERLI